MYVWYHILNDLNIFYHIDFSTMSSALNSAVAVTMEDFVIPLKPNIKEKMLLALSKSLSKLKMPKKSAFICSHSTMRWFMSSKF